MIIIPPAVLSHPLRVEQQQHHASYVHAETGRRVDQPRMIRQLAANSSDFVSQVHGNIC